MAASSADYFTEVGSPGTATTLAAPGHSIGGSSFTVVSTSNWPTLTGAVFAVDTYTLQTVNGVANVAVRTPGSYTEWEGVVASSTSITNAVLRYGTDQNYSAGTNTRVYIPVASSRENRLVQGLQVQHNQDGTHGVVTATSINTVSPNGINQAALPLGAFVQGAQAMFSAVATGTTLIPLDDTIPQITEGTEFMTLSITPKAASNILVIRATVFMDSSISNNNLIAALFQDSTANALAAQGRRSATTATVNDSIALEYAMVAGTTSSTTFRIRAGGNGAATFTFNGASSSRLFGTTAKSSLTIMEYKA